MNHRITEFEFLADREILLRFADGSELCKDFAPLIEMGAVFARLAEEAYWQRAEIADDGMALAWPSPTADPLGELDFCADALWFEAHPAEYAAFLSARRVPAEVA